MMSLTLSHGDDKRVKGINVYGEVKLELIIANINDSPHLSLRRYHRKTYGLHGIISNVVISDNGGIRISRSDIGSVLCLIINADLLSNCATA